VDVASWIVATLFGAMIGAGLARFPEERRIVLGAIALMLLIGVAAWIAAPTSIAGPSLTVGGATCAIATLLVRRRNAS
jgi:hypothetical protein